MKVRSTLAVQSEIDRLRDEEGVGSSAFLTAMAYVALIAMMWLLAVTTTVFALLLESSLWRLSAGLLVVTVFSTVVGVKQVRHDREQYEKVLALEHELQALRGDGNDARARREDVELTTMEYVKMNLSELRSSLPFPSSG